MRDLTVIPFGSDDQERYTERAELFTRLERQAQAQFDAWVQDKTTESDAMSLVISARDLPDWIMACGYAHAYLQKMLDHGGWIGTINT